MKTILAIGIVVGAALIAGCGNHNTPSSANGTHEHAAPSGKALSLDHGNRWQADDHTRASVKRMQQTLAETDPADRTVGSTLQKQTDELIRGCTMTGEPHDQLHIWLNEFMPALNRMVEARDDTQFAQLRGDVQHHLEEYDRYFK